MHTTLPPHCLERFEPVRLLASGGFGIVLLGRHRALGCYAALKVLNSTMMADPEQIKRFCLEARLCASITHPNVVKVIDADIEDGVPWIAYEFLTGKTLREALEEGPIEQPLAIEAAAQVAEALGAAHALGIVHRDVKPENVMETESGVYKLTDFGIAKWSKATTVQTRSGIILGTPAYLSPEIIRGDSPGPRSDIYALGMVLFELLSRRLPFSQNDLGSILRWHQMETPPPVGLLVPGVSPGIEAVVAKALRKRPEERFDSASRFAQALRSPSPKSGPSGQETVEVARPDAVRLSRTTTAPRPARVHPRVPGSRKPVLALLPLVIVAMVMVVSGLALFRGRNSSSRSVEQVGHSVVSEKEKPIPIPTSERLYRELQKFRKCVADVRSDARKTRAQRWGRTSRWKDLGSTLNVCLRLEQTTSDSDAEHDPWFSFRHEVFEFIQEANNLLGSKGGKKWNRNEFGDEWKNSAYETLEALRGVLKGRAQGINPCRDSTLISLLDPLVELLEQGSIQEETVARSCEKAGLKLLQLIKDRTTPPSWAKIWALTSLMTRSCAGWHRLEKKYKAQALAARGFGHEKRLADDASEQWKQFSGRKWTLQRELLTFVKDHEDHLRRSLEPNGQLLLAECTLLLEFRNVATDLEAPQKLRGDALKTSRTVCEFTRGDRVFREVGPDFVADLTGAINDLRQMARTLDARLDLGPFRRLEKELKGTSWPWTSP